MARAIEYIVRWERQAVGAQWSNFFDDPKPVQVFSVAWCVFFMNVDAVLHLLLMWYFEQVVPGIYK